jgi:putative transcriptional regulator
MSQDDPAPGIHVALDEVLTERGMSLADLARAVDITYANLSVLKNGHAKAIRFSTLAAISEALDCEPGDILRRRDP